MLRKKYPAANPKKISEPVRKPCPSKKFIIRSVIIPLLFSGGHVDWEGRGVGPSSLASPVYAPAWPYLSRPRIAV
jgi:hypothetical protein